MRRIIVSTLLVAAVSLAGCAASVDHGSSADEGASAASEDALTTFGKSMIGDWDRAAAEVGPFDHLVLKGDGTFFAETQVMCVRAPCNPIRESGRWSAKGSSSSPTRGTLFLHPKWSEVRRFDISRAQDGSEMKLRDLSDPSGTITHYAYALSYCDADADCVGQKVHTLGQMCMVGTSYRTVCATDAHACVTKCLP